jgi:hypothetical protein
MSSSSGREDDNNSVPQTPEPLGLTPSLTRQQSEKKRSTDNHGNEIDDAPDYMKVGYYQMKGELVKNLKSPLVRFVYVPRSMLEAPDFTFDEVFDALDIKKPNALFKFHGTFDPQNWNVRLPELPDRCPYGPARKYRKELFPFNGYPENNRTKAVKWIKELLDQRQMDAKHFAIGQWKRLWRYKHAEWVKEKGIKKAMLDSKATTESSEGYRGGSGGKKVKRDGVLITEPLAPPKGRDAGISLQDDTDRWRRDRRNSRTIRRDGNLTSSNTTT